MFALEKTGGARTLREPVSAAKYPVWLGIIRENRRISMVLAADEEQKPSWVSSLRNKIPFRRNRGTCSWNRDALQLFREPRCASAQRSLFSVFRHTGATRRMLGPMLFRLLCDIVKVSSSLRFCGRAATTCEISEPAKQPSNRPLAHDLVRHLQVMIATSPKAREHLVQAARRFTTALSEVLARPEVNAGLQKAVSATQDLHGRIAAIDAPGYTPYFESLGHDRLMARFHAGFVRSLATRLLLEDRKKRVALSIIHDLAKRRRWHPAFRRQVAQLCDACSGGEVFDEGLRKAGRPDLAIEFPLLLQRARNGDHAMSARFLVMAAMVAPYLPSARGRPLSFEGALHQAFLRWNAELGERATYTYGPVPGSSDWDSKDDFTDAATIATRIELNRPSFNPIAARRAVRRRILLEANKTSDSNA